MPSQKSRATRHQKTTTLKQTTMEGKIAQTPKKKLKKKEEALTVSRFIHEVLVDQLSIRLRQVVNDTTFVSYTGSKRPDLLISEFEYDQAEKNDQQFIENLVAFAEAKDDCVVGDADWKEAVKQGAEKAPRLKLPYYIVTNCRHSVFLNAKTGAEIKLNGNPIREFQSIDIFRLIKNRLTKDPNLDNIITNVDSLSAISEATFNKKLWELAKVYRNIKFENNAQIIDFTIGFISLEYFEERESKKDAQKIYWSDCYHAGSPEKTVADLAKYITRLEQQQFTEFSSLMERVRIAIVGTEKERPLVTEDDVQRIYEVINSMKPLKKSGFDLFGAVYEKFANSNEKKKFGEYFTRRHYTHIFAKLLLKDEQAFDKNRRFTVLDPACGTGGFLTEGFKVLQNQYAKTGTLTEDAEDFLEKGCFYGIDVRKENISRTKLNMFLVGDAHTHMTDDNTLTRKFAPDEKYDYILTNPPVGAGNMKAECSVVTSYRDEVCFLYKVLSLLKDGHGEACILLPDGVLENPQFTLLRKDLLEKCTITAIVSLPKFAFAPYTKEKMYAVFFTKRSPTITKVQKDPIWMYIIDNDGFANSDKRFPTKLRNNRNGWLHDEVSGWVSIEGEEEVGILEEAWLKLDDSATNGTEWIDEKGEKLKLRKGGFIDISKISKETQFCLMPEYYLRPFEPVFVTPEELVKGIEQIENATKALGQKPDAKTLPITAITYQAKDVPVSEVLNRHSGNSGLTEQEIYLRLLEGGQKYRVISAATMEEKELGYIPRIMLNGEMLKILEDEEGIAIVRKGKAGVTSFYEKGRYALTDDAYFLTPKSDSQYELDLRWLVTQYKQMFFDYSSSSDNGTWNMTNFYANAKIDIPSMPLQQTIVSYYKTLSDSNKNIEAVLSEINRLKSRQIVASYKNYQAKDYPISKVLNCHSGNSGLTAEIIYHWSYIKGDKYEVLSSATTEEKKLGFVPKFQLAGSGLVVFEGIEGILVSRNGNYAGTVTFLEKGRYTLTDHAYFLSLSPTCPYAVSLKWIVVQYRRLFLDYSSSNLAGNNATWNMTRFFKDVKIDIPSYEEQLELVRQYEKLESMQANLSSIKTKIDHYFARQFVAS